MPSGFINGIPPPSQRFSCNHGKDTSNVIAIVSGGKAASIGEAQNLIASAAFYSTDILSNFVKRAIQDTSLHASTSAIACFKASFISGAV